MFLPQVVFTLLSSFLPIRFVLMLLSAVLPRGRQKVKQEKSVVPYGQSALLLGILCKEVKCSVGFCHGSATPLMEGSPLGLHSSPLGYCWSREDVTSSDWSKVGVTIRLLESLITCNDSTGRLKQNIQWTTRSLERMLLLPSGKSIFS